MNNEPNWLGGKPSFSVTLTPGEIRALLRDTVLAAMKNESVSLQRVKLAMALEWLEWKFERENDIPIDPEDARISAAETAGRAVATHEIKAGHTAPRDWTKDGDPYAGAYSHLAAAGFSRIGARMYALTFIRAYLSQFPDTEG